MEKTPTKQGVVIKFTHTRESPWDSDLDSLTSTPDFKRGKHSPDSRSMDTHSTQPNYASGKPAASNDQAIREILQDGIKFSPPKWVTSRQPKGASILIFADSQLENWPAKDKICTVEFRRGWAIKRWVRAIRTGEIRISCNTVVLYLETTRNWMDVPPVKNILHTLCKTIKLHAAGPRVFVANHLPRVTSSPVNLPVINTNFTLQQATRSVCRAMGGVFEMSIHEHFVSRKGKLIKPRHRYFVDEGALSTWGCMIFRECLLREAGVKGYWFSDKNPRC